MLYALSDLEEPTRPRPASLPGASPVGLVALLPNYVSLPHMVRRLALTGPGA